MIIIDGITFAIVASFATLLLLCIMAIVWLGQEVRYLRKLVYALPDKNEIIQEIVATKIPITMGPDGKPVLATGKRGNPLTG